MDSPNIKSEPLHLDSGAPERGRFLVGLLWGLLLPVACFLLVYFVRYGEHSFRLYLRTLVDLDVLTKVISLCLLPDLAVFYVYLRKNEAQTMKGLIAAAFLYVLAIVIL